MKDVDKLQHTCTFYHVPGSLVGIKPPGANYRKYQFTVECMKCQSQHTVHSTSRAYAERELAKYPALPFFPK